VVDQAILPSTKPAQSLRDKSTQGALVQSFSDWVYGRQVNIALGIRAQHAALGMRHFKPRHPAARPAETAQQRATREHLLLNGSEVEKPQRKAACAIADPRDQHAAVAQHHLSMLNLALDHGLIVRPQATDGGDASAILIANGQVEQQLRERADAEPLELLKRGRAGALEAREGLRRG
jgi:hypothetical protein